MSSSMEPHKKENELARKGVHTALATLFAFLPLCITQGLFFVSLGALFLTFLILRVLKVRTHFHHVVRVSYGELFFPIGILSAFLILEDSLHLYTLSVLILAFADPLAALVGKKWGKHIYHILGEKRSLEGSFACFFTVVFLCILFSIPFWVTILSAFLVTIVETISVKGSDNLTIPLVSAFLLEQLFK